MFLQSYPPDVGNETDGESCQSCRPTQRMWELIAIPVLSRGGSEESNDIPRARREAL